jgi:hypothetical protein
MVDLAEVEEIIDQPHGLLRLPLHDCQGSPRALVDVTVVADHLHGADNGGERAPQLMCQRPQQLVKTRLGRFPSLGVGVQAFDFCCLSGAWRWRRPFGETDHFPYLG